MKTIALIIIIGVIIAAAIVFLGGNQATPTDQASIQNVQIVDGVQIVEIRAKAGYTPRVSTAQAGVPTIVRFISKNTFDCSASVRIPSFGISDILPNTGTKDFDLGTPTKGTLNGSCGMGMYPFEINFQE
jgi:plastocyanin domain-containing protein